MENIPILLPEPRDLKLTQGVCNLSSKNLILLDDGHPQTVLFPARSIQIAFGDYFHLQYDIKNSSAIHEDNVGVVLRLDPRLPIRPQGYSITIAPDGISIEARYESGLFYASCTMVQLVQYYTFLPSQYPDLPAGTLPCLEIHDWPDFTNRGVMLDISRDKVPTMDTIFDLVDLLASWKVNQLQLYTEHTFAYQQHPEVWAGASPFTGDEILKLDLFCRERYIELVPNQNSFGHLERWLKHPRYRPLAEAPDGFDFPWGHHDGPFSLCPLDPGSIDLISSLCDELLPNFSSRQFNVGCDETFDLGQGRSKLECEQRGNGPVYLDFLLKIYQQVTKRGFRMQFWGDIIMAHPELVEDLPKDVIALEWGYDADHPFDDHGEKFAHAGLPFYVCPGTSTWNSIAGRTDNCLLNLANAAQNGIKYGANGYLITDWGDNGHWQALPVSYLGLAAGAAYAWSFQTNQSLDICEVLNRYAFLDPSGNTGKLAYDLGNVYHAMGLEPDNGSALFYILQMPIHTWKEHLHPDSATQALNHTRQVVDQLSENLSKTTSLRTDKDLLLREFTLTADLLRHSCKRGIFGFDPSFHSRAQLLSELENIVAEYQQIWLSRNRPGGLSDSLAYFETAKNEYQ